MVPHLTAVLGTMLPMLGLAKYDNMRWVFASGNEEKSETRNLHIIFNCLSVV